jgi:hypothetical protein
MFDTDEDISNTGRPGLYQTECFAPDLIWETDLPAGKYDISLYFAEIFNQAITEGVEFHAIEVYINNVLVADNLDIIEEVGGYVAYFLENKNIDMGNLLVSKTMPRYLHLQSYQQAVVRLIHHRKLSPLLIQSLRLRLSKILSFHSRRAAHHSKPAHRNVYQCRWIQLYG